MDCCCHHILSLPDTFFLFICVWILSLISVSTSMGGTCSPRLRNMEEEKMGDMQQKDIIWNWYTVALTNWLSAVVAYTKSTQHLPTWLQMEGNGRGKRSLAMLSSETTQTGFVLNQGMSFLFPCLVSFQSLGMFYLLFFYWDLNQ